MRLGDYSTLLVIPIVVIIALFSIQLVVLRIREINAIVKDPHLGRKTILYFFYNICVFMLLGGLTVSIADYMEYVFEPMIEAQQAKREGKNGQLDPLTNPIPPADQEPRVPVIELTEEEQKAIAVRAPYDWTKDTQRICAGLILSGLLHALFFKVIALIFTNDWRFPSARRAAAGIRFVIAGLIVLTLSTTMIVGAFQKGETDYKTLRFVCSVAVVWGPVFLIHAVMILFFQRKLVTPIIDPRSVAYKAVFLAFAISAG